MQRSAGLRWRLADGFDDREQPSLFAEGEFTERHIGRGEFRGMEFLHVNARSIINEVPRASRVPFRYTVNVYRGCSHACTYCFARPTHEYLGFNIGEDFERRIVVKINAVECLRAELAGRRWAGHPIAMGTHNVRSDHQPGSGICYRGGPRWSQVAAENQVCRSLTWSSKDPGHAQVGRWWPAVGRRSGSGALSIEHLVMLDNWTD